MSDTQHAVIQPSAASRWVRCGFSLQLEALFPDEESEHAKEGTLAHEVAAELLRHNRQLQHADVTEEMRDGAEMMQDDVTAVRRTVNTAATLRVEEKVDCSEIHAECWGTLDVSLLDVALNKLYVWDYKFGHRYVDPFENYQLLAYAIGKLRNYGTATRDQLQVHLRIVQPRSYHPSGPIREWVVSAKELFERYLPTLREAAEKAMAPGADAAVGEHCRDCKGRHQCTTLQEAAYSVVHLSRMGVPHGLAPDAAGRELALLEDARALLDARISGLEGEVAAAIRSGAPVPFYALEASAGRMKWSKSVDEVLTLGALMGVDVAKPAVITPKQAIKAGIPEAVVATYAEAPRGEAKLVRVTGAQARKVFGGAQ